MRICLLSGRQLKISCHCWHIKEEKIMITLSRKMKKKLSKEDCENSISEERVSIRDQLLIKEVQEMEHTLPSTCSIIFGDPNILHEFTLTISPDEGYWIEGYYNFHIYVPDEYNMVPPKVKCLTRIWHPNISVSGDICLSLLRHNSIDGLGWSPTRRLRDVIWGLNSLFSDLLNFDDPLNCEAADQFRLNKDAFQTKVKYFNSLYARR